MHQPKTNSVTNDKAALVKAEHYCAYQERSQQEVRDKLHEWGLSHSSTENIIVQLLSGNYLNEERFALAYAIGKFRQKGWGRNKIKQGLQFKRVSDPLIKKALKSIDGDEYLQMLKKVIQKRASVLNETIPYKRQYKLHQYALSRGYENDLIADVLKDSEI